MTTRAFIRFLIPFAVIWIILNVTCFVGFVIR